MSACAARSARRQSPRTFVRRALFLARMSVGDARVYTCTCTIHDKLSCTHLQNYTIGASLKSVLVSVSVSVQWNLSFTLTLRYIKLIWLQVILAGGFCIGAGRHKSTCMVRIYE